jgi:hypothetical protein
MGSLEIASQPLSKWPDKLEKVLFNLIPLGLDNLRRKRLDYASLCGQAEH